MWTGSIPCSGQQNRTQEGSRIARREVNMNIERAIEFLVKNQGQMDARFNAKFDRADKRLDRIEHVVAENNRVVAQNNRIVTRLARLGVSLRGDVRGNTSDVRRTEKNLAKISD